MAKTRLTRIQEFIRLPALALAFVWLLGTGPLPAVSAFMEAYAKIDSYVADVTMHETNGNAVQDRTYRYSYLKPHFAKAEVTSGPGKGGGVVWRGGDTLKGHQGGFFSRIKVEMSIHDRRAVSLRGDTIEFGSIESVVADLKAPNQTESSGTVDAQPVAIVTISYAQPENGVVKEAIAFSKTTHLPIRRTQYGPGDAVLKQVDIRSLDSSVKLTEADFN
jgi:hypothetical protein